MGFFTFSTVQRRVKERFSEARGLAGEEIVAALKNGQAELAMVKRQAVLYAMFDKIPSIMERRAKH